MDGVVQWQHAKNVFFTLVVAIIHAPNACKEYRHSPPEIANLEFAGSGANACVAHLTRGYMGILPGTPLVGATFRTRRSAFERANAC